jgi:hypothetical protein
MEAKPALGEPTPVPQEMRDALKDPNLRIALPVTFTHGRGVQLYIKTRKVGPMILKSEGQTLADLLHMLGTMAEED